VCDCEFNEMLGAAIAGSSRYGPDGMQLNSAGKLRHKTPSGQPPRSLPAANGLQLDPRKAKLARPLRNCALPARPDQNSLIGATHGARRWTIQALRRSGVRLEISSVFSAASVEYS
jgi:hypothetical protein